MNETKFTPGPWVASFRPVASAIGRIPYASFVQVGNIEIVTRHHSLQYPVLVTPYKLHCDYVESEASPDAEQAKCINGIHPDAHLIAAAPDLYDALRKAEMAMKYYRHLLRETKLEYPFGIDAEAEAVAALAKARGEAQ